MKKARLLPRPILKWAGGKTQLLGSILPRLPAQIDTYYEPFVGGGAVFFELARLGRFRKAVLADRNPELVEVYQTLKDDVDSVIREVGGLAARTDEESYYEIRAWDPATLDPAQRTARIVYLNKVGFNGLFRVNRSGLFNVPYGRRKSLNLLDEPNLRATSLALKKAVLLEEDFEAACKKAKPGDAVYFDPPYVPLSKTSNFTAYDRHPFDMEDHQRLAQVFGALGKRGVYSLLSNSSTPETRELYRNFDLDLVKVARRINCQGEGRGEVDEILVENRPSPEKSPRKPKRPAE